MPWSRSLRMCQWGGAGWYLRYLLLKDDLRVEFDLNDPAKHGLKMQGATQLGDSEYFYASGWYYTSDENSVDGA